MNQNGLKAVQAPDDVLNQLTGLITSGELDPGDRLPSERKLAETFGISRPVVREALRVLATQGLISIQTGRGAFVTKPSAADTMKSTTRVLRGSVATARDVLIARKMLERQTVRLAAQNATEADIRVLEATLDAFESAGGVLERASADLTFHARLSKSAHNPVLDLMFSAIAPHLFDLMLRTTDPTTPGPATPLHRKILEAIRAGDADRAEELAIEHAEVAYPRYAAELDIALSDVAAQPVVGLSANAAREQRDLIDAIVRRALED